MNKTIEIQDTERYSELFNGEKRNIIAMNAVTANGINKSARCARPATAAQYEIVLDEHGITNQKSSGRCWMFAALNCVRARVIEKLKPDKFELSQNYTHFYDKLEKANHFLNNIIATAGEDLESREVQHLLKEPVSDGGQWDMITSIIEKYGVVPKEAMPETACSESTKEMNALLNKMLRTDACALRKTVNAGGDTDSQKKAMLGDIYRVLCVCLGVPPEKFDFKIRGKDGVFTARYGMTPKEFFKEFAYIDFKDYISLINSPTADKPYMQSYTVKYLGNVAGGNPVKYVNVPVKILKSAAVAQMKDGEPVWFGCDVGKMSDKESGVMDLQLYDYDTLMNIETTMTKADRLDYGGSKMTHAMVFRGVDFDETGAPEKWRVENSWGTDRGEKGMFLMTDEWFDEYMYQVVVNKKYLPEDVVAAYNEEPVVLAPWDPMGSLA